MRLYVAVLAAVACGPVLVAGHGSMLHPRPRSSHNQVFDDRNKCGCQDTPEGCYSNATSEGFYCGLGCVGEACLYYQIGCFQGCGTCSYEGKTLYPQPEDLVAAGCAVPPAPTLGGGNATLEKELRTYNIDNESALGDWTKWNPWRSPGSAGRGGTEFQPCGVNSGSDPAFPDPPAAGQEKFGNGTDLPPLTSPPTVWKVGSVVEAEWSIYANHGGGYSFRLCKKEYNSDGEEVPTTEACYQKMPLNFATNTIEVKYYDNSRAPFMINATTTDVGTYPPNSQWRKNPIPMCNCDIGTYCGGKADDADVEAFTSPLDLPSSLLEGDKTCKSVLREQCGTETGVNTCLKCGQASSYDCEECCPGLKKVSKGVYNYCVDEQPKTCDPSKNETRPCFTVPYKTNHLHPGQIPPVECSTGVMFETQWNDGAGAGIGGTFMFTLTDKLQVPADATRGNYSLSWRWDCEQTPQVWNSCADVVIEA